MVGSNTDPLTWYTTSDP